MESHFFWEKKLFKKSASNLICVLRQTSSKCKFRRAPPIRYRIGGGLFWSVSRRKMGVRKSFCTRSYLIIFVVQGWKRITKQKVTHVSLKIFEFSFFPFVPAFRRFCTTNEISTHILNQIALLSTWKYAQLSRENLFRR